MNLFVYIGITAYSQNWEWLSISICVLIEYRAADMEMMEHVSMQTRVSSFFVAAVLLTIVLTKIVNIVSSYIISLVITTVVIVLSLLLSAYNICFLVFCVFNVSF